MIEEPGRLEIDSDGLGELYGELNGSLRQIVRFNVRAPDVLVEDACQVAWIRLVRRVSEVRREAALSWLATTASREAVRMVRRADRELPLTELNEEDGRCPALPTPEELVEFRSRVRSVGALPTRQQRLVWLRALGLSYTEMSGATGESTRTVHRQLVRARHHLRSL